MWSQKFERIINGLRSTIRQLWQRWIMQ
jgi:hypothetical protein